MATLIHPPNPVARAAVERPEVAPPLSLRERLQTGWQLEKLRVKEYLQFDARVLHWLAALAAGWLATGLLRAGQFNRAFSLLAKFHRGGYSRRVSDRTEEFVRMAIVNRDPRFMAMLDGHIANVPQTAGTANFFADPLRILKTAALVLRSPDANRKGIIVLKYNHVFPLVARFFDLPKIAERYHLVLEPSWSGYCDLNLLAYTRLSHPVFVQAIEPHDTRFLTAISSNLKATPVAANWWIDYRILRPLESVEKEFDVVMVSGWGVYKRHHRVFDALARLRRQGRRIQTLLLGYSVGWTKEMVLRHARYYGVQGQIKLLENVPYDDVNLQLNRAKIHLLWSRHEGFNRAIIEAMLAGLPCILRDGFNYGYRYPYVNNRTARFATEINLPGTLTDMLSSYTDYAPREWILEHMNCHEAGNLLEQTIADCTSEVAPPATHPLAIKVNALHAMRYFEPQDEHRFSMDYEYLEGCFRRR